MTYKQHRPPAILKSTEKASAFLLEKHIANGQRLIDHKDISINVGNNRKGEPDRHAAGIDLDRLIDELANIRERDYIVKARINLFPGEPQYVGIHVDVFAATEFGVEPGTQLQQGGNSSIGVHAAVCGCERAADQL